MTVWRPPAHITVKALGIIIRQGRLLAMEVRDDRGALKGVRPPGGTVEFGESRSDCLRRELREELNSAFTTEGNWLCFENIYSHEGAAGHEIVFALPVTLEREEIYLRDRLTIPGEGEAAWFPIDNLGPSGITLFPPALLPHLVVG